MGNCVSTRNDSKKNKLELYLNDVYENECEIKIEKEEIEFIRTGIETLTQDIADKVLERIHVDFEYILERFSFMSPKKYPYPLSKEFTLTEESFYKETSITELYFPGTCSSFCENYPRPHARKCVLKVGSFYEGTRNSFHDEFDNIFLLFCSQDELPYRMIEESLEVIHKVIQHVTADHWESLHYGSNCDVAQQGSRVLYFNECVKLHGPASMLEFIYINSSGEERPIHVDLSHAIRLTSDISQYLFTFVGSETFQNEIWSARNHLYIDGKESVTETEVCFMKYVLSKKHRKVFRILKHLINGHDGEELKEVCRWQIQHAFTSYDIKLQMIEHHDWCENQNNEDIGPCVLQMLIKFCEFYRDESSIKFCQIPYIKKMIKRLGSMQTSKDSYDYERYKNKSTARQCLDDKEKCVIL